MNKVADKVVPKEIAPLLPIASMFIPGLQAMGPLMRYGLPQLMTALGSAKRTGKVNPMAQAMTGLASYARGPGPQGATGKEQAFFDANVAPTVEANVPFANTVPQALTDPASKLTLTEGMDPVQFAARNQDAFQAFDFVKPEGYNVLNQMGDMGRTYARGVGDALNNPFSSLGNLGTAATLGTAPALSIEAVKSADDAKAEQEAQIAANQQAMTNRENAISNLTGLYGQMGTDPTLVNRFNPWEFYNQGGRVGYSGAGYVSPAEMGLPDPFSDNSPSPETLQEISEQLGDMVTYDESSLYEERLKELMKYFRMNQGGRVGHAGGDMVGGLGALGALHPMNPAPSAVAPGMPNNMQVDGRNGSFIPMGAQEKHDDVPAMLAKNEFVMTSDAVKGMGNGDVNAGAQKMYDLMNQLEANV
jgi:hypothetical protein